MNTTGNTILITGGGSGIGRGLAEAFHKLGNHVIVAGRRKQVLDETVAANPGMSSAVLDIENAASIRAFTAKLVTDFPDLNAVIHNAGIMRPENLLDQPEELTDAEAIITTNLLGPIRLTAALLPHFQKLPRATILTVTSGLAFIPLAMTPTYNATKAAIHSYTQSLRYQLQSTNIKVIEIVPPYVQTELMGSQQASDPRAMPLVDYLNETINILKTQPDVSEVLVERVKPLRFSEQNGPEKYTAFFKQFNDAMAAPH
ncbi:SDR family oxidoreductase [Tunturiibacter gelidoferens]|uniref:Oxidoreductase n=1 Tax=Tunturiibacter gelidiferens TaxID=3069689 RepID=A0A9X0QIY0_9BACT|nr:SDR family oxidoreductase [Edaphobacter lichenicola]MBB5331080.1 putative oxidoreductase [Edaphobacter lichenicola]